MTDEQRTDQTSTAAAMKTIKDAYTSTNLAGLLGISDRSVRDRAKREGWQARSARVRGGGNEWLIASMPEDTAIAIRSAELREIATAEQDYAPVPVNELSPMDAERRAKALARSDLVRMYMGWLRKHGTTVQARADFMAAYEGGAWPELLQKVGKTSWKTLERWKVQQRRAGDLMAIADKRGLAHRGKSLLTERHRQIILGKALHINNPSISYVCNQVPALCMAEGLHVPSPATIRRFLSQYMGDCYAEWTFVREGKKAWNDKAAIWFERNWGLVEVGDILIADGHTLNFETTNPDTGKPCRMTMVLWYDGASNYPLGWELMPTENTACISAALRRACIRLGKRPRIAYLDNGKAFRARHFKGCADFRQAGIVGLYEDLGVEVIHAWAYHGQSKPVERFFGTFHELENWVPSYTGRSIDTKPARLHRGETVHRKLYDALGGRPLTVLETHAAIAHFFDAYVLRPQRGHLAGRTPREVFMAGRGPGLTADDLNRLNLWMLSREVREVGRGGTVGILGRRYYAPELYGKKHAVVVRYDDQRPQSVLVYATDGRFLAEAQEMQTLHPAAYYLGEGEHREQLADALAIRREQEKLAGASARALLDAVVIPEHQQRMAQLASYAPMAALPDGERALPDPAPRELPIPTVTDEERRAHEALLTECRARIAARPAYEAPSFFSSPLDRYEYLFQVSEVQGLTLTEDDAAFKAEYEKSSEYSEVALPRYEQQRRLLARMAAMEACAS